MKLLTLLFLLLAFAKVMLVGVANLATQGIIPGTLVLLVALMLILSANARAALRMLVLLGPPVLMVSLFVASGLVGIYNSLPLGNGLTAILRALSMLAMMVGSYLAVLSGNRHAAEGTLYATFLVHISAAIVLYFAGVGYETGGVFRPTGLTGRPQLIANIASFAIIVYLCRMLFVARRPTAAGVAMLALGFVFVILSGTLKNFLAVILVGVIAFGTIKSRYRVPIFATGVVVLGLLVRVAWSELPIGERLSQTIAAGLTTDVAIGDRLESSLMWRMLHWKLLLTDWYLNYRWTGAGIGQVVMLNAIKTDDGRGFAAHSDWIGLLVELGPILFAAFVATQFKFYSIIRHYERRGFTEFEVLRMGYILFLIMSVAGNVMYSAAFSYQFWWLAGITAATLVRNVERREKEQ